eukprot:6207588-Pleurochrysis_carterae.AAC.1
MVPSATRRSLGRWYRRSDSLRQSSVCERSRKQACQLAQARTVNSPVRKPQATFPPSNSDGAATMAWAWSQDMQARSSRFMHENQGWIDAAFMQPSTQNNNHLERRSLHF